MLTSKGLGYLSNLGKELKRVGNKLPFVRRNSKSKEEKRNVLCKPTGLYKDCKWEEKEVKKLVLEKKIAPRWPGSEDEDNIIDSDECPICFRFYPSVNTTTCCSQLLCTECYLQVQTPERDSLCPFGCKDFGVKYHGPRSESERKKQQIEEQTNLELHLGKEGSEKYKKLDNRSMNEIETASSKVKIMAEQEAARQSMVVEYERAVNRPNSSSPPSPINMNNTQGSSSLQVLEDMMLLEAIRASLSEETKVEEKTTENINIVNEESKTIKSPNRTVIPANSNPTNLKMNDDVLNASPRSFMTAYTSNGSEEQAVEG